jgi:hypothetical protein
MLAGQSGVFSVVLDETIGCKIFSCGIEQKYSEESINKEELRFVDVQPGF